MGTASGDAAKQTAAPTMTTTPPGKSRPRWRRALIAAGAAVLLLVGGKLVDEALSRLAPQLLEHLPEFLTALRNLPLWAQALGILGIGALAYGVAWLILADRQEKKQEEAEQAEQGRAEQGKLLTTHVAEPITTAVKEVVEELKRQQPSTPPASEPPPSGSAGALPIFTVPRQPTPYFTGRDETLESLHATFTAGKGIVTQAITGLGGIGKTQTALEYAFRHQREYQAAFWVQAETRELLIGDFGKIAALLQLPERDAQKQEEMVAAVRRWLEAHPGWLLILDNVEEAALVQEALPTRGSGHLLLTTRAQALGGVAQRTDLKRLPPDEAAHFLLRRAHLHTEDAEQQAQARAVAEALGYLPLALDQTGAYIDETRCGLKGYLDLYQKQRRVLLRYRGAGASDHPESVAVTWNLAFKKVRQTSPAAADLLRLCAFLHPEAIPEDLFSAGADELTPTLQKAINNPLQWNAALASLRRFSLIERQTETQTLSLHRLVQAVLQDALPAAARRAWAERAVRLVNATFPPHVKFANWPRCQQLVLHAMVCASHIEQWQLASQETARLLNRAGYYLEERAQYAEALPLFHQALAIREQTLGPNHLDVANSLNNLAGLYYAQGQYGEVLPLFQRALAIKERALGLNHPDVAQILNNLAALYKTLGQYAEALPLLQRALTIREQTLGSNHPDVAQSLNNLAQLYDAQEQYAEALPLYQRVLKILELALGPDHPLVAGSLINLAMLYENWRRYPEALPLLQRALAIQEQALGPDHPDVARSLSNLAAFYQDQRQYEQALPFLRQALAIKEKTLRPNHPDVAISLNNLAALYYDQGQYEQALPLFQRALAIWEQTLGPDHPNVATCLENMAGLLRDMRREGDARPLEERAQAIRARRGAAGDA